jgi:hypothetical protein
MLLSYLFSSCSFKDNGAENLASKLFSNFLMESEYTISTNGETLSGSARVNKGKTTRIDILAPDPYTGMSVESDASGAPSILSFSYSGINVEFTPEAFSKLNLAFQLMSPKVCAQLEKSKRLKTQAITEAYTLIGLTDIHPVSIALKNEGDNITFVYDKATGTPLAMSIESDNRTLTVKVTKIKFE